VESLVLRHGSIVGRPEYDRAVASRPKHEIAREHFELALEDIEGGDDRGAVSALFYAAEAAIVAIADAHSVDTKRNHRMKADAASELHSNGVLDEDFGPLLRTLNQERKDVWYEGEEPDFGDETLEDVAERVRGLIEAAEADHD
jgi:HEPN domain-containing protein